MKKVLAISLFSLALAAGNTSAIAAGPVGLTDAQLDIVDAGGKRKARNKRKHRAPTVKAAGSAAANSGIAYAMAGGKASASGKNASAGVDSKAGALEVSFGHLYIGAAYASNSSYASTGRGRGLN